MPFLDFRSIGNNLYKIRRARGLTQAQVAEIAEISDRAYADIERGSVNMRLDSLIKICSALNITPNHILISEDVSKITDEDILQAIKKCSAGEREVALKLLNVYISSIR